MTETKTPETTPSPKSLPKSQQVTVGKPENPTSQFTGMALDMSWKLAIVVLVPIIGGYEIDSHAGTTPVVTIIGFLLAMLGVGYVMWQTLQSANRANLPKQEKRS
jgi:F0F1-type ATP synthase assembly protein I